MTAAHVGRLGESLVSAWFAIRGYRILARNWRCDRGELDLVAFRNGVLCFVEVKSHRRRRSRHPGEALTWTKRKRIVMAAQHYLHVFKPLYRCVQFGLVEVTLLPFPRLTVILDAFRADEVRD